MNRKEFIRKACQVGVASGATLLIAESDRCCALASGQEEQSVSKKEKFTQDWIRTLMNNMDTQLDEGARVKLMELSGRACARQGAVNAVKACKGDLEKFLVTMRKWVGADNVRRDGSKVFLTYSKCLCPQVQSGSEKLSDTYCNCSRGWVKEMYETVLGTPVDVQLTESIKRGGEACRFIIRI
jgi:predicted hydrocarbon binding protein